MIWSCTLNYNFLHIVHSKKGADLPLVKSYMTVFLSAFPTGLLTVYYTSFSDTLLVINVRSMP